MINSVKTRSWQSPERREGKTRRFRRIARVFELDFADIPGSVILTSFCINLLGLALPLVALQIYDRIIPNNATGTLAFLMLGLGVVIIVDTAMKVGRSYLLGWEAAKRGCAANIDATRRLLGAPRHIVDATRPTTWMDRLDALAEVNGAGTIPARIVLIDILFMPIYFTLFAMVGGLLLLVPIAVMVPAVILIARRGETLRESLASRAAQDQRKQDFLVEILSGIQVIKSMAMEPQIQRRYERLQRQSAEINYDIIGQSQSLQSLGTLTSSLATVAVVTSGALLIVGGTNLSIGALACCSLLTGRLMQPLMKGVGIWSEHQSRIVSYERAAPLRNLVARSPGDSKDVTGCLGGIAFNGAGYCEPDAPSPVLNPIDLNIAPGEIIAIRPLDSAAKSAFLGLIRGDITATEGEVAIDGHTLVDTKEFCFRHQIARVSNASDVVAGTILENLTMFGGAQSVERVRHYAQAIGLEDTINILPEGYDTPIGDAVALQLPNGVLQQIAIVRALARDPAILIVDEAYTCLDSQADPLVVKALADMRGERTIIIAAHRPSYLALADRQFDLAGGRLVPAGSATGAKAPAAAQNPPARGATVEVA